MRPGTGGSMIPSDLRQAAEAQSRAGSRGIGGAAQENASASASRDRAMGMSPEQAKAEEEEEQAKAEAPPPPCPRCKVQPEKEHNFCSKCGQDLVPAENLLERLGIQPLTDDDMNDYLFKGYIEKEIPVLGRKATIRTTIPKDSRDIDAWFMVTGPYKDKQLSGTLYQQLYNMATMAVATSAFDGIRMGDTLDKRMAWWDDKGAMLADLMFARVRWLNIVFSEFAKKKDTLPGS